MFFKKLIPYSPYIQYVEVDSASGSCEKSGYHVVIYIPDKKSPVWYRKMKEAKIAYHDEEETCKKEFTHEVRFDNGGDNSWCNEGISSVKTGGFLGLFRRKRLVHFFIAEDECPKGCGFLVEEPDDKITPRRRTIHFPANDENLVKKY